MSIARTVSILTLFLFQTCPAVADCIDGARKATIQEKRFHGRVLSTIEGAMPAAPNGWMSTYVTDIRELDTVCNGGESLPMGLGYRIEYSRMDTTELEGELLETATTSMVSHSSGQALLDALDKEQEKLSHELGQAVESQDFVRIESVAKRMEAVGRKMEAVFQAMDQQLERATEEKLLRDTKAVVIVNVNAGGEVLDNPEAINLDGVNLAFRIGDGRRLGQLEWREGASQIYLGKWQTEREGATLLLTPLDQTEGHTEARTVSITVQAERARAGELLGAMDLPAIQGLLQR
jgi:hypothetical protein